MAFNHEYEKEALTPKNTKTLSSKSNKKWAISMKTKRMAKQKSRTRGHVRLFVLKNYV